MCLNPIGKRGPGQKQGVEESTSSEIREVTGVIEILPVCWMVIDTYDPVSVLVRDIQMYCRTLRSDPMGGEHVSAPEGRFEPFDLQMSG